MEREPNTQYVLSLSYGKDSLACLEAIRQLNYPLDRVIHAEVWATDTVHADLPPMVAFKEKADKIILDRYGYEVEHVCATKVGGIKSYESQLYHVMQQGKFVGTYRGFPKTTRGWCVKLKIEAIKKMYIRGDVLRSAGETEGSCSPGNNPGIPLHGSLRMVPSTETFSTKPLESGAKINTIQYLGIAADEPERIERHSKRADVVLPLVDIGWDEAYCRSWCEENDLLSPIYTSEARGGCWFCPNQRIDGLRRLRSNYPDLWAMLLKWDTDSPVKFRPDGITVHNLDKRFEMEEQGLVPLDNTFKWKMVLGDEYKYVRRSKRKSLPMEETK